MASAPQIAHPEIDVSAGPAAEARGRTYLRYFLLACIIPVIGYMAAFPLVCSRSYEQWGETQWGPELEFPYAAGTPDADVVIFGDSSAFLGIDPRIVNAQLGIRSVVLPSTVGSLPVIGDGPLREYLAHHSKPKLIVLYFSAWNLDYQHAAKVRLFEGEEMMMRHARPGEIARFTLQHPLEMAEFPLRLYSSFSSKMVTAILHHQSRTHDIAAGLGHAPYIEKFGPLTDLCRIPPAFLNQRGDSSVEELRKKYESPGTQVMVYLAPIPDCTNSRGMRGRSFAALNAAPPAVLPARNFAADIYYAHIRTPSVPVASRVFADALEQRLELVAPELLRANHLATSAAPFPVGR